MPKVNIKQLLNDFGPCVSSDFHHKIMMNYPSMSPESIRKMISRSNDIEKLSYIYFSHNRRFIYDKKDFGSFKFWNALKRDLLESNSVYSYAILSIMNNGGFVRKKDFGIICGSPYKQSKHLSYSTVLSNMLNANLFRIIDVDSVGECVVINNNTQNDVLTIELAKSEVFFEKPIVDLVKSWIRNIGLISFNQIRTKYDDGNPVVGSFEWGLTAPSYIYPLSDCVDGKLTPGFVACDFHFDFDDGVVNESIADTFLRKVEMTRFSRKCQRIMFIIFARKFNRFAFKKLKANGVLAITITNAFGSKIDSSVEQLARVVKGALSIDKNPEQLIKMVDDFESITGENGNIRGYLFELFVSAYAQKIFGQGIVYLNKQFKFNGESAEVDVVFEDDERIICIECKNRKKIPSSEVTEWIRKRIRITNSFFKEIKMTDKKVSHYLWVTGEIKDVDIIRLDRFKDENKSQEIDYKHGIDLKNFFGCKKNILDVYNKVIYSKLNVINNDDYDPF